jgi:hypothetical protein
MKRNDSNATDIRRKVKTFLGCEVKICKLETPGWIILEKADGLPYL